MRAAAVVPQELDLAEADGGEPREGSLEVPLEQVADRVELDANARQARRRRGGPGANTRGRRDCGEGGEEPPAAGGQGLLSHRSHRSQDRRGG